MPSRRQGVCKREKVCAVRADRSLCNAKSGADHAREISRDSTPRTRHARHAAHRRRVCTATCVHAKPSRKHHKKSTLLECMYAPAVPLDDAIGGGANAVAGTSTGRRVNTRGNFSEKRLTPIKTVIRFRPNVPSHHNASEPVIATKRTTTRSPTRTPNRMVEGFASPEETQRLIQLDTCTAPVAGVFAWIGQRHARVALPNKIRPSAHGASAAACGSDSRCVSSTGPSTGCFIQ